MTRLKTGVAVLAALLALPLQAGAATLRWANDGDASAMDPYTRNETFQGSLLANIYEGLLRRNRKLELEPSLATAWAQTSPTVWRFTLRQGVKWQDGTPFTAEDVVFSFHRAAAQSSMQRSVVAGIAEVRSPDPGTVELVTENPNPILPQVISNFVIMSKAWCEAHDAAEPVVLAGNKENYAVRQAMGTGPFRLVSREPDRRTVLERNPTWWDTPEHNLDRVEFTVIGNASTRVAALISGDMDMIYTVPPQDADRIARTPGLHLVQGPELRTIFLGMDQGRDELLKSSVKGRNPFKDLRVRQAFMLAIDEPAIAARIMRGQARPTALLWGPGVNGYDPALDQRPVPDVARAKALMAEAGYADGFTLGLDCPNDRYVNDEAICTAVVPMLARIGVKVELSSRTKARHFAEINPPGNNTSFFMLGWSPSSYDAHNVLFDLLGTQDGSRGADNDGRYSNPGLDKLVDRIGVETDQASRQTLISEAARLVQADIAAIPLHQQVLVWAAKDKVDLVQRADNYFALRYVRMK